MPSIGVTMGRCFEAAPGPGSRVDFRHSHRWIPIRSPWQIAVVAVLVAITVLFTFSVGGTGPPNALHLVASGWLACVYTLLAFEACWPESVSSWALTRLAWSAPPVILVADLVSYGLSMTQWDLMWLAASLSLSAGRGWATDVSTQARRMLRRLGERDALVGGLEAADALEAELERAAHRWALTGAFGMAVIFIATGPWTAAGLNAFHDPTIWPTRFGAAYFVPVVLGFAVVGAWLGRGAAVGRIGTTIRRLGMRLRIVPDHPDGAGGLRPIGAYFLHQSVVASMPPMFTIVWLFLFAVARSSGIVGRYELYASQFKWLLLFFVMGEILAFLVPMYSVHTLMRREKETMLWSESDELSRLIKELCTRLDVTDAPGLQERQNRVAALARRFEVLEETPTWPIDSSIRRRFTLRNLGLLVPIVGYLMGNSTFWERLGSFFTGLQ